MSSPVEPQSPAFRHINSERYTDSFANVGKCKSTGRDISICYNVFGDLNNPCFLCIQGLATSLLGYSLHFIDILLEAGFCVVRYDNRDCGRSTKLDGLAAPSLFRYAIPEWLSIGEKIPYTLEDMMEDGIGLLRVLGIEKAHIFGMSMGGMIAQLMAIHHPEKVLTLNILFSHIGGRDHVEPPLHHLVRFLEKPKTDSDQDKIQLMLKYIHFLGQGQYKNDPQALKEYFEAVVQRNGEVQVSEPRHVAALMRAASRKRQLQNVTCPTLIMHGMKDPLIPYCNGELLAKTIPNAILVLFPRLGHIFPPQLHREFAELLIDNTKRTF